MNRATNLRSPRSPILAYFSLFTSLGTLLCCALPSLLVLLGLGASVASMLSFVPWLVTLSRHKQWTFAIAGILVALSFVNTYYVAPRLGREAACGPDSSACRGASRLGKALLWISSAIYVTGLFVAYVLGPILSHLDNG
jgi:hypothetical protein